MRRGGALLIAGVFALGLAALNTGNNVLYLLLGALLGLIVVSGWLSEQSLSRLTVVRRPPGALTAGQTARIEYQVRNRKRRAASVALELSEADVRNLSQRASPAALIEEFASLVLVPAGGIERARALLRFPARGVWELPRLTLATAHPFGMFRKERDVLLPGRVLVWPRTDLLLPPVSVGGRAAARLHAASGAAPGAARGDFRTLREYRPGDDPRDVHWRTSARRMRPIVREYEPEAADTYWIVLDLAAPPGALAERSVELAASLAARAARQGDRFGCAAGAARLAPSGAAGQLEAVLDLLAQVSFAPGTPLPAPAHAALCVLVCATPRPRGAWAAVVQAGPEAEFAA